MASACLGSRQSVHLEGMSVRAFAKRSKRGDLLEHNLIDLSGEQNEAGTVEVGYRWFRTFKGAEDRCMRNGAGTVW